MTQPTPHGPLEQAVDTALRALGEAQSLSQDDADFYAGLRLALTAFVHTKLQLITAVRVLKVNTDAKRKHLELHVRPSEN